MTECGKSDRLFCIARREWRFVLIVAVFVLAITAGPYIFAQLTSPPEKQFMGFVMNVSDHAQYLAWYEQFQRAFLIPNPLTSEDNPAVFFNLLWFILGRLGLYTGLSYGVIYQAFRWIAGGFFLAMVYALSAVFFADRCWRRAAFLITTFGSGLGWFWVLAKYTITPGEMRFPSDLYIAEGNSLLCLMAYPHFIEAAGLIAAALGLLLLGERRGQLRYALFAGLVAHLLGWQHAYDLIIVWSVPTAYGLVRWLVDRRWPGYWFKAMLIVGLVSWPPALYSVLLTRLSPIWEEVLAQFPNAGIFTPNPLHLLILMGIPLLSALLTLVLLAVDRPKGQPEDPPQASSSLFLGVWLVLGGALAYIPTDFQIHMLNSWQIPIAFLCTLGLLRYAAPFLQRWLSPDHARRFALLVFLALIIPANVYLWIWRFVDLNRHEYPYYLYQDELLSMEWIRQNAPQESVVLSSYDVGRYVPGLTGRRAYLAHWAGTVRFFEKRDNVAAFYSDTWNDSERGALLQAARISYVWHGPAEKALGDYHPSGIPWLSLAYSTPYVEIYAVQPDQLPAGAQNGGAP